MINVKLVFSDFKVNNTMVALKKSLCGAAFGGQIQGLAYIYTTMPSFKSAFLRSTPVIISGVWSNIP